MSSFLYSTIIDKIIEEINTLVIGSRTHIHKNSIRSGSCDINCWKSKLMLGKKLIEQVVALLKSYEDKTKTVRNKGE